MRRAALISLLLLAGCKGMGLSAFDTSGPATPPGISNMDAQSPDAEDNAWFGEYYGKSHGWGWTAGSDEEAAPDCDFYGNCKSSGADSAKQSSDSDGADSAKQSGDSASGCDFYGNCKSSGADSASQGDDRGGGLGW